MLFILLSTYAASNVPQRILDLRPSIVRVLCDFGDGTGGLGTGFAVVKKGKVRLSVKRSSKNIPLERYLLNTGGKLPFEMALFLLHAVIRKLADMHAKGMCQLADSKYQLGKTVNWKDYYKFTFVSPNEMTFYCYKNNKMYEMYRE